jgi:hypothetical protein
MNHFDLFSGEARKALTKYKVYTPKTETLENNPNIMKELKTTNRMTNE